MGGSEVLPQVRRDTLLNARIEGKTLFSIAHASPRRFSKVREATDASMEILQLDW